MDTREFLQKVKSSITFPSYQARLDDEDILSLANEEQNLDVATLMTSLREDFLESRIILPIAAGTETIDIPERAIGRTVKELKNVSGSDEEEVEFYVEDDALWLNTIPTSAKTFELTYEMAFGDLVLTTKTGTIISVDVDNVVVAKVPTSITVGTLVDITKHVPGFRPVVVDAEVLDISGTTITLSGFDADTPLTSYVREGFSISVAKQTSILQMPVEVATVLIKYTGRRILQAQNMPDQVKQLDEAIIRAEKRARQVCSPRDTKHRPAVINRNGLLNGRSFGPRFRRMSIT